MSDKPPYNPVDTPTQIRAVFVMPPPVDRNAATRVPCPWCAPHDGRGLVLAEVRAKWMSVYPELHGSGAIVVPASDEPSKS